jgi:hypothetical protein
MRRSVLTGRRVTAAHVPAREAEAEVDPAAAGCEAFLASLRGARLDRASLVKVSARPGHGFILSARACASPIPRRVDRGHSERKSCSSSARLEQLDQRRRLCSRQAVRLGASSPPALGPGKGRLDLGYMSIQVFRHQRAKPPAPSPATRAQAFGCRTVSTRIGTCTLVGNHLVMRAATGGGPPGGTGRPGRRRGGGASGSIRSRWGHRCPWRRRRESRSGVFRGGWRQLG